MNDKAFLFEMATIALFTVAGTALLIFSLPGLGVVAVAGLLSLLTFGTRKMGSRRMGSRKIDLRAMGSRKTVVRKVNRFALKTALARE